MSGSKSNDKAPIKPFVYFVAVIASFGGLLFGYDIGGSGPTFVMESFRVHFGWPASTVNEPSWVSDQQGWISAIFTIGALVGALASGTVADFIGRKPSLMICCVIFTLGAALQTGAVNIGMMYAGRFVGGVGIGSLSSIVPMFQAEIAPKRIRGMLVTLQQLSITFGIVLAGAANVGLARVDWGWRISYGGNIILSCLMFVMLFLVDESPRWLIAKGKEDQARKAMSNIRQEYEVEYEIQSLTEAIEHERAEGEGEWKEMLSNENNMLYRTFLGCGGQFLQQLCGINAIMFFAPKIFSTFFSPTVAIYGNLAINIANFLATFIAVFGIERFGRTTLLLWGAIGMLITTLIVCILASPSVDYQSNQTVGIFIIVFCVLYVINFAYSWGPVIWVVCSEIYPNKLRGKGMSLSTATNWGAATIVGRITPLLLRPENLDLWGTFLFFSCWIVCLVIYSKCFVPETAGVPLERMDALFDHFKVGIRHKKFKDTNASLDTEQPMSFNSEHQIHQVEEQFDNDNGKKLDHDDV